MSDKTKTNPHELEDLKIQLEKIEAQKRAELKETLCDRLDIFMRTQERIKGEEFNLDRTYLNFSQNIMAELLILAEKQKIEKGEMDFEFFKERFQIKLDEFKQRIDLMFQIAEENHPKDPKDVQISSFEEFAKFNQLKSLSPFSLEIIKKIKDGTSLEKKEWDFVVNEVKKVSKLKAIKPDELNKAMQQYPGLIFMTYLTPKDRMNVMLELLEDKKTIKTIISLTAVNYLSIEQGEELIKALAKRNKVANEECLKALELLGSEDFIKYKTEVERLNNLAKQSLERNLDKNYAGKILSVKGILIWYLGRGLGLATMLTNFFANVNVTNILHPSKWGDLAIETAEAMTNPGVIIGASVVALSAESISGGLGRGGITEFFGKLMQDKAEIPETIQKKKIEVMQRVISDHPRSAQFYFQNAKKIVELYENNPKDLSLKNLEISFSTLSKPLQKEVKDENRLNQILQELARSLYDPKIGIGMQTYDAQQNFINEARDAYSLTRFS